MKILRTTEVPEAMKVPEPERTLDPGGHESLFAIPVMSLA